ncbi:hypothetical protein ACIQ6K_24840 [Streptomyces sp. NPDC096354]
MSTTTDHLIETVDGVSLAEARESLQGADVKTLSHDRRSPRS